MFRVENQPTEKPASTPCRFPLQLIFNPEDGGDIFFRNSLSGVDNMALYPRRWQHLVSETRRKKFCIVSFCSGE
jgi:hypothetical protein